MAPVMIMETTIATISSTSEKPLASSFRSLMCIASRLWSWACRRGDAGVGVLGAVGGELRPRAGRRQRAGALGPHRDELEAGRLRHVRASRGDEVVGRPAHVDPADAGDDLVVEAVEPVRVLHVTLERATVATGAAVGELLVREAEGLQLFHLLGRDGGGGGALVR